MAQPTSIKDIQVAAVLDGMDEDRKFAATSNKTARVKIDRGNAWLVRFLPFPMGTRGLPWARLAQHWIGGKPIYCKQHTSPEFGGDPTYECPVCQVADTMYNQAADDSERDDFYSVQARIHFMMYCIVLAKETDRGVREDSTPGELLVAHEFNIPKSSYAVLAQKIERSKSRKGGSPNLGLLDLELGQDIWASRDKKNSLGFELSEDGPAPIFNLDDSYEANVLRVWKGLKQPSVQFFADRRMISVSDKIAERAFEKAADEVTGSRRGNNDRNRGARGHSRENDDDQDQPRGRSRAPAQDDQDAPQISRPTRQSAPVRESAPVGRPAPRQAAPTRTLRVAQAVLEQEDNPPAQEEDNSNPELQPVDSQQDAQQDGQEFQETQPEQAPEEAPTPPVRRAPVSTARPATRPNPPPAVQAGRRAQAPRATPPSARGSSPAPRGQAETGQIVDDPEEVAEEAKDPAPARASALPPRTAATTVRSSANPAEENKFASILGPRLQGLKQRQA